MNHRPGLVLLGVAVLFCGFLVYIEQQRSTPSSARDRAAGGASAVHHPGPVSPEPTGVVVAPNGERIVRGTVDALGFTLPLDVRRPRPPRALGQRPARWRTDAQRSAAAPPNFVEHRLGPDNGHTQNETTIDFAGDSLIAGWNQVTDTSFVMGVGRSVDSGQSWTWELLGGHDAMSDPIVKAGGSGRWYFGYVARGGVGGNDFEAYVRRSDDDGATWQSPVPVNLDGPFDDKPYLDARGDEVLVAYSDFSFNPGKVRAARSLDGGQSFEFDTVLANASVGGNGACPVIASDGTWYVFWRDSFQQSLWISRSLDQGETWSSDVPIIDMNPLPSPLPGGFRMVNFPAVADDPNTGDLVLVWNDQLLGDPDILSIRSSDGGVSWSEPVRVNDDVGTDAQFLPWVAIDDAGVVHVMWYDRRHNGFDIDVYLTHSLDGGKTYEPNTRVTGESFPPVLPWDASTPFIGDYNGLAVSEETVYPFYQDARSGDQDVYVALVPSPARQLFVDNFESGDLSAWSSVVGAR